MKELENELINCETAINSAKLILENYKIKENQAKLQDSLDDIKNDLGDQLLRIKKNSFEIAVVGREKAGKLLKENI